MRSRVLRLDALILAILSYARSGQSKHAPREVDVGTIVKNAIELSAASPTVQIEIVTPMPKLLAQETPLQQVFLNLIGNALKHGLVEGAGRIEIGARDRGGAWEFWVKDGGKGIAPEHYDRVWSLFSRIVPEGDGTGIGLAVVRRIVDTQGGRTWVRSTPDQGATFWFSLPDVLRGADRG
jgi:signal transduction histidine kinase